VAYVVPVSFSSTIKSICLCFLLALIAGVFAEDGFHHGNWRQFWWSTLAGVICLLLGWGNVLFLTRVTSSKQ
jgi:biotin transporter BioY